MSNYIELAKKLHALANGGVSGEKQNAERALNALMQKHGITMEQLEENILDWREFKRPIAHAVLFHQVAMAVVGNRGRSYRESAHNKRSLVYMETTVSEQIEIQTKFDFYLNAYKAEQEALLNAFVMRHNLYNKDSEGKTADELSMEELQKIAKAANLARGMEHHEYLKALNPPEN